MHIVIVNPFDPLPWESKRRTRYSMLAAELVDRGHQVSWITADFDHNNKQYRKQPTNGEKEGIQALFTPVPPYYKNISPGRISSHNAYASGVSQNLRTLQASKPIDVVIASIPPTNSARVAMEFCDQMQIVGIVDMQDAWPKVIESVFPSWIRNFLSKTLLRSLNTDVKLAVNLADGLVGVSPELIDYLSEFCENRYRTTNSVFSLGFDTGFFKISEIDKKDLDLPLKVSYIGNFSHFYDLETVIKAAKICEHRPIEFNLIGNGPTYDRVKQLAHSLELKNVSFSGRLAFDTALPLLLGSEIGLLPYTSDWPANMPNKVFDYLFLGLPIISSIKGNLERTMQEYKFGLQYEPGNAQSLANTLFKLSDNRKNLPQMGLRGLEYATKNMDGKVIYHQYANFIEKMADSK